ncbi:DUF3221 domain-containing protein [Paenibacillus aestuarii]|uniref:DUF3221 domain-containing protein n=1 Tax=Paenibacillus aestuarii TaxID=516965 RepID=A0ABW0K4U6_9BACL|nr:DUF3221 domain-containing protein [Paenibacillus aestuarii]
MRIHLLIALIASLFMLILTACSAKESNENDKILGHGIDGYISEIDYKKKNVVATEHDPKAKNDDVNLRSLIKVDKKTVILKDTTSSKFDALQQGQHIRYWFYGEITNGLPASSEFTRVRQIKIIE